MAHVWDVSTGATGAANDESFARTALTREGVIECAVLDDAVASRWPALVDALFQARKPNTIWVAHNNDDATALASRRGAHHLVGDSLDALVNRIIVAFLDWKYAGIYAGGPKRWTAGQEQRDFETQWHNMAAHVADLANKTLLVPFAGDSPIVQYAHECGIRSVTAVEWAPVAIAKHRERFGGNVPPSVHLVEAEWFAWAAAQPPATYDVVLDKDCFGFLTPDRRAAYVRSVARLLARGGHVYLEVKERADTVNGPPFHVTRETAERAWSAAGVALVHSYGAQPFDYSKDKSTQMAYLLRKEGE